MAEGRRSRGGGARTAAIAVSAAFHLGLLVLLVHYAARTAPAFVEPPVIQATLVPPARPDAARRDKPRSSPPNDRARTPSRPERPPAPPALLGDVTPFTPSAARLGPGPSEPAVDAIRPALQGLGGCERAGSTRREREDCEARRWANAAPTEPRLNLDLSGRYAKNPEPFLSRRPSKGCRARLAGDVDGMGNDMNARAGVTCVKPF